jgi:hypothetical protein
MPSFNEMSEASADLVIPDARSASRNPVSFTANSRWIPASAGMTS